MEQTQTRRYTGTSEAARLTAFNADAVAAAQGGWFPISQASEAVWGNTVLVVTYTYRSPAGSLATAAPGPDDAATRADLAPPMPAPPAASIVVGPPPPPGSPALAPPMSGANAEAPRPLRRFVKPLAIAGALLLVIPAALASTQAKGSPGYQLFSAIGELGLGLLFAAGGLFAWTRSSLRQPIRVAIGIVAALFVVGAIAASATSLTGPTEEGAASAATPGPAVATPAATVVVTAAPSPPSTPFATPEPSVTPTVEPSSPPVPSPTPSDVVAVAPLVIGAPADNDVLSTSPVVVRGTGPVGERIVQDVSLAPDTETVVGSDGTWSLTVDLNEGQNDLTFRVGDDQSTATTLTVTYAPPVAEEPTAAPVAQPFRAFTLKGHGSRIARFRIPADEAAIAVVSEKSSSNFVVWTLNRAGHKNDLLVNEIGSYRGTRLFDTSEHSVAFKVTSNGSWTITVKPVTQAKAWNPAKAIDGVSAQVLRLTEMPGDFALVRFRHRGSSNFVIWAHGTDGTELMVNEIGRYNGEDILPAGTLLMEILADGRWSIRPE